MAKERPLPADVGAGPKSVVVLLFSQADCEYCAEVRDHYLRPLLEEKRPSLTISESRIDDDAPIRDWRGRPVPQRAFARASGARFAPTVMFLGNDGQTLAAPIVGLSHDFFGSYLEQRLAAALTEVGGNRLTPA